MNKVIGIGAIFILVSFLVFSLLPKNNPPPATADTSQAPITDIKASFAIFTNGTFRVFTASMYHKQSRDAYIEASSPNTVYVKKAGSTWNDFFSTLPFTLTSECLTTGTKETFCTGNSGTLKFYINGQQNKNALNQEIKEDDKLLISFGQDSEDEIRQQLTIIK